MERTLSEHPELEEGSQAWHVSRGLCEISSAADVAAAPIGDPAPAPAPAQSRKPAGSAEPKNDAEPKQEVVAEATTATQPEPGSNPVDNAGAEE
jgi:hypothetical protein